MLKKKEEYSRHSGTLAPGTALVVWFDVRLQPIFHYTANRTRDHVRTPVPIKLTHTCRERKMTHE